MTIPAALSAALDALGVREPEPPREKLRVAKFREYTGEF